MPTSIGWIESARQRLNDLARLGPGWDDGSALPIPPALIERVWRFLATDMVSGLDVQPDIVPTFQGGLLIEWHTDAVDLIIESAPASEGSFYFHDNETSEEVETVLGDRIDAIAAAFRKLGRRS